MGAQLNSAELKAMFRDTIPCAKKRSSNEPDILKGVLLFTRDGYAYVTATDRFRVAQARTALESGKLDYAVFIPREDAEKLQKQLPNRTVMPYDATISLDGESLTLTTAESTLTVTAEPAGDGTNREFPPPSQSCPVPLRTRTKWRRFLR